MDKAAIGALKLLLMDCDGVLTDGRLYFSAAGEELKVFDVKDGQGLALWHKAGFHSGIISGRGAHEIISLRAKELGIETVITNSGDKLSDMNRVIARFGFNINEVAFVGDDIGDLSVIEAAGVGIAVGDAVDAVKQAADYVTKANGGRGAIREIVELFLSNQNR